MNYNDWKCRASAVGKIMHLDTDCKITPKQLEMISLYQTKEKLTDKQSEELQRLIAKRDAPPTLSKGAKTYLKDAFFGQIFDFEKRFTSKFTEKGNQLESPAIRQIVDYLGLPMVVKNETHYSNDFIKGTPDTMFKALNFQFDVKNVYYPNGLDTFEKIDYDHEWQLHSYNWMAELDYGFVIKILMNPTDEMIYREARVFWVDAGGDWKEPIPEDFLADVKDYFDFETKRPIEDRINIEMVQTTNEHKKMIQNAVELSRIELNRLSDEYQIKNRSEILAIKQLHKNRGKLC